MVKRTGPTNPYLRKLIEELKRKSLEAKAPIWKATAQKLSKPRRQRIAVNLSRIDRHTQKNDVVLVPGIVLASGNLSKPLTIAAWKFSKSAREKVLKAKGRCLSIEELVKKNPKGSDVKIIS